MQKQRRLQALLQPDSLPIPAHQGGAHLHGSSRHSLHLFWDQALARVTFTCVCMYRRAYVMLIAASQAIAVANNEAWLLATAKKGA